MNENPPAEVTPIQETPPTATDTGANANEGQQTTQPAVETGTEQPVIQPPKESNDITQKQLDEIITTLHTDDELHTLVQLPNGTAFDLVARVTVGEALIASAIFLLLSFQVIKWLLNQVWGRH